MGYGFYSWRRTWATPVELLASATDFGRLKTTFGRLFDWENRASQHGNITSVLLELLILTFGEEFSSVIFKPSIRAETARRSRFKEGNTTRAKRQQSETACVLVYII